MSKPRRIVSALVRVGCVGACLWMTGCIGLTQPTVNHLERGQDANGRMLEQQAMRLEMQEAYLAQLAQSQQQLAQAMQRVETKLVVAEPVSPAGEAGGDTAAEAQQQPLRETIKRQGPTVKLQAPASAQDKLVLGRTEWVWFDLFGRNLKAQVDTGARASVLMATDLQPFERDGKGWIRFRIPRADAPPNAEVFEAPLEGYVRTRQGAEKLERRPVVRLRVRLGSLLDDAEFILSDREGMPYPVLLGRAFLRDVAVVDVARKFTQPKSTPDASARVQ